MGTRSRMCLEVGRCGYMGMLLFYIMSRLVLLVRRYHITCVEIICTCILIKYTVCNIIQDVVTVV